MADFAQYREINARLKKRFNLLRKPNLREASDSFRRLSSDLKDFKDYSGYCLYSAAKCEHQIVGALKEQLNQTMQQTPTHLSSSSSSSGTTSSSTTLTPPTTGSSSGGSKSNQALENLLLSATWTEFQTWLDTARTFRDDPEQANAAISAYAHAIQTCPSPRILCTVLCELAAFYQAQRRFTEAAEIFQEANLFREAADCLMSGHHYEDAYHCYQELFKKQPTHYWSLSDATHSRPVSGQSANSANPSAKGAKSILSFFTPGNKKSLDGSNKEKTKEEKGSRGGLPPVTSENPFEVYQCHLTIDDYITVFLLRLYLYDPVRYEYPSPIIPIPADILEGRMIFRENVAEEEETETDGQSGSGGKSTESGPAENLVYRMAVPFVEMINGRCLDRSLSHLIEINLLLETLYLSYRHELKSTIDNEYLEVDSMRRDEDDSCSSSSEEEEEPQLESVVPEDRSVERLRRQPSHDSTTTDTDDHQLTAKSLTESADLDDISLRLEHLAAKFGSKDEPDEPLERRLSFHHKESAAEFEERIDRMMHREQRAPLWTDDHRLRKEIATRLFPLLNHQQNQLVYEILNRKQ